MVLQYVCIFLFHDILGCQADTVIRTAQNAENA